MASEDRKGLEGQVKHALPYFNMEEIYNPTMVTISVSDSEDEEAQEYSERTFTVQRELICRHSEYFRAAFESGFKDTAEKAIAIKDVHPNIFATFMDFLFHNEVSQAGDDPTEWCYDYIFRCFIFADKYDACGFRNRIFEAIQMKLLPRQPTNYSFPDAKDVTALWAKTTSSSKLRQLLVKANVAVFEVLEDSEDEMASLTEYPT